VHSTLEATLDAAQQWYQTADDRLAPQCAPGILDVRVSAAQMTRALDLTDQVIAGCMERGLTVQDVERRQGQRAGIGIGPPGAPCPIHVVELRERVFLDEEGIERWLAAAHRGPFDEMVLRDRGYQVRADGRLRFRLARRHDPSPYVPVGWRWSFTDQVGRRLEQQVDVIVAAIYERSLR
jgi:hypothetical protein